MLNIGRVTKPMGKINGDTSKKQWFDMSVVHFFYIKKIRPCMLRKKFLLYRRYTQYYRKIFLFDEYNYGTKALSTE